LLTVFWTRWFLLASFLIFKTYNTIFEALITARKVEEASSIFREMTKNEFCPLYANYVMAIKMYFEADDPEMAIMMWKHMIQKAIFPKSDCAAILIDGFCDLGRASEALKYSLEAITRRVQIPVETLNNSLGCMFVSVLEIVLECYGCQTCDLLLQLTLLSDI